jgi:hypothetical protein
VASRAGERVSKRVKLIGSDAYSLRRRGDGTLAPALPCVLENAQRVNAAGRRFDLASFDWHCAVWAN